MNTIDNNIVAAFEKATQMPDTVYAYTETLKKFEMDFRETDKYLEVGEPEWTQGWIIDISVVWIQLNSLLETILPFLKRENVPFKVAKDAEQARALLSGELGYLLLGKVVAIYPGRNTSAVEIAKKLIELTCKFKGPNIPTDRYLGGVVFTRYGSGKPVICFNDQGFEEAYIYDSRGNLIKDPHSIPFRLPDGVIWPFRDIATPVAPRQETVLQDKYKPMAYLKDDTKGTVRKGLYLERWWRIKWCVIKEGKKNMGGDYKGRDMTDRLGWQNELHKDLENSLPIPRIYDFFEENGNSYLVMEYIKGRALNSIAPLIFHDRTWSEIPLAGRLQLLAYFEQALDIIGRMHKKGYVHRDITPANFLVVKGQKLKMIDLELSYNINLRKPYPPFRLGTPGYMSPEQQDTRTPKFEQDYYALGSLLIRLVTGLAPEKFALEDVNALKDQLFFFIRNKHLANIICNCLNAEPTVRPNIEEIKKGIAGFRELQQEINIADAESCQEPANSEIIGQAIYAALSGLSGPAMVNADQLWESVVIREGEFFYPLDESKTVSPGFSHGLSGVMYLLATAHRVGFSIDTCLDGYYNSMTFINERYGDKLMDMPGGLFFGSAGIAVALAAGLNAGLIQFSDDILADIKLCLQNQNIQGAGVAKGIAGRGLALLQARAVLEDEWVKPQLDQNVGLLLSLQQPDGSWSAETDQHKNIIKPTGFGHGLAGIICFLAGYCKAYPNNDSVRGAISRGLEWLIRAAIRKGPHVKWRIHEKAKYSLESFQDGLAGISLSLLKAYEVIGKEEYRLLAEDCLSNFHPRLLKIDSTQSDGMAGLGEVYLEAARILGSAEWKKRADWIAQVLLHHSHLEKDGSAYWLPNEGPFTNPSLMGGNSGIIYFLLHYRQPSSLAHPLIGV